MRDQQGIGILYGKEEWFNKLPPYQGGGEMIKEVSFEKQC
jgi:cysteine desulfurase/selenocysteine lyase